MKVAHLLTMSSDDGRNVIIFLFGSIAIGALMRLALKDTSFPYTVAMILVGLTIGSLTDRYVFECLVDNSCVCTDLSLDGVHTDE